MNVSIGVFISKNNSVLFTYFVSIASVSTVLDMSCLMAINSIDNDGFGNTTLKFTSGMHDMSKYENTKICL